MATVTLGNIKFNWKGAYNASTAYVVDDVVSHSGSSYVCILASTGNVPTNTTYWEQMSSAGTNGTDGTDIGTVITTQGDILYRDGSGLARLAAGTSGQVLQTGGSGANPSWGTVSSDFVKLGQTGAVSAAASVSLNGFFSSTYKIYKVYGYHVWSSASGNAGYFRANTTASYTPASAAEYFYAGDGFYRASGTNGSNSNHGWSQTYGRLGWTGGGSVGRSNNFELTIFDPEGSNYKKFLSHVTGWDGSATMYHMVCGNHWRNSTAMTGIEFSMNTGDISADNIIIYGLKA